MGRANPVLDVMVTGAALVTWDERRQGVGRIDPVDGCEREQEDACDHCGNDEFRIAWVRSSSIC
jgi:hypothetical protein